MHKYYTILNRLPLIKLQFIFNLSLNYYQKYFHTVRWQNQTSSKHQLLQQQHSQLKAHPEKLLIDSIASLIQV